MNRPGSAQPRKKQQHLPIRLKDTENRNVMTDRQPIEPAPALSKLGTNVRSDPAIHMGKGLKAEIGY